jgi:glycosyltransferase involved in cell wall biosynthesis
MLSRGLGGVQSAFSGYAKLLRHLGHEVVCCVSPRAPVTAYLPAAANIAYLPNWFERDPVAIWRAVKLLRAARPDLIMVHGKRALMLFDQARRFAGLHAPLVNVLHRHRLKHIARADMNICVSDALREEAAAAGVERTKLASVPNFLAGDLPEDARPAWNDPPVIGFLARMVPEKGLDLFIDALAILKSAGVRFSARIGGDGETRAANHAFARARGLDDSDVQWLGWVEDIAAFQRSIDLICVPSRWESFGLVILGAFKSGVPVVATRTTGPASLIIDKSNGLLCDIDAKDVAHKLRTLIENPDFAGRLAEQARRDVLRYEVDAVAPKVDALLTNLVKSFSRAPRTAAASVASGVAD